MDNSTLGWVAGIGIPLLLAAFSAAFAYTRSVQSQQETQTGKLENLSVEFREYKTAAAMSFATVGFAKDIEIRMVSALERIENKLDRLVEEHFGFGSDRRPRNSP